MATHGAEARELHLERLLRVATCLAEGGYGAQVGQLAACARAFYSDAQVWGAQVHHKGARGRTHLMYAARMDSAARVQYLLDRGAFANAAESDGWTALILASNRSHLETVRCLVERGGANANAARTIDGYTALMTASDKGHLETVRFLVERGGADVNAAMTTTGSTALMIASSKGNLETVRCLVERGGANVNAARTTDDVTALMWACQLGHIEIVRCLVRKVGLDINAASSIGCTALHLACSGGLEAVAALLLSRGADPSLLDHQGHSAQAHAAGSAARLRALLAPAP
jgi:ankyrin repeat protein